MKKHEVVKYCQEKSEEGWMTHLMILEIYDDFEDIPDDVVDMICYKPKPSEPFILYCGTIGYKAIQNAMEEYSMHLTHEDILKEHNPSKQ